MKKLLLIITLIFSTFLLSGQHIPCHAAYSYFANGTTVNFTDKSTGNITAWVWDFGDGLVSALQHPTHIYAQPGTYIACLSIYGTDSCSDMQCRNIVVHENCTADFQYSSNATLSVSFTNNSVGGSGIRHWDFGDGSSSAVESPVHVYPQSGYYTVGLSIGDSVAGCFDYISKQVHVNGDTIPGGCQAQFTWYPDSTSVPAGFPYHFIDLSQGNINTWSWYFGDGTTSSEQNPTHIFASTGSYHVCLTIYSSSCQTVWCEDISVDGNTGCSSYFTYQKNTHSVSFEGHTTTGIPSAFDWNFGDGASGQGQSVTHAYANAGIYHVVMFSEDSLGCHSHFEQLISISDSAQFHQVYGQVLAGNFPLQQGLVMIFSMDTTQNFYPYVGVSAIDSSGVYVFPMVPEGSYYIYALPILPAGFAPTYYGDVLNWISATLVHVSQPENPYNIHLLSMDSLLSGAGSINGIINISGLKSTLMDKVTMLLLNEQENIISYDPVGTSGIFTFPALGLGTYFLRAEIAGVNSDLVKVVISAEQPNANVNMTFTGNSIIGINEQSVELIAGPVFPNPVTGVAYVQLNLKQTMDVRIVCYSTTGSTVWQTSQKVESGRRTITLNVSALQSGFYTVKIITGNGYSVIRKLVKL